MVVNKGMYLNKELCSACQGSCCKNYPGIYNPEDFKKEIKVNFVLYLLASGKISIDYWEGKTEIYFLRPRRKGALNKAIDNDYGSGECINLTDSGCSLKEKDKPEQCKTLEPKLGEDGEFDCVQHISKQQMVQKWFPHQKVLREVVKIIKE